MRTIPLLMGALAMVAGCTSLDVNKFDGKSESSRRGIAYFLPFTQFETKITWSASCDKDTHEFALTPKIDAKPKTGPDPNGLYVIDYESLSAFTKTSSVKVDFYDSGSIKSINASADDRTGEILTKTISAVGKVAKLIVMAGDDKVECTDGAGGLIANLKAVADQKTVVESKTALLEQATDALTAFSARLAREGSSITDRMRNQHSKLIGSVVAAQIELDAEKAELEEMQTAVSYTAETVFPSTSDTFATANGFKVPLATLKKWIKRKAGEAAGNATNEALYENRLKALAEAHSIHLDLAVNAAFAAASGADSGNSKNGIRYRIGVPGELRMCKGGPCTALAPPPVVASGPTIGTPIQTAKPEVLKALPVTVLQQGTTFFLPFHSEAFTNGALTATFSEAGVLTSAGYEQKKAQGEVVAGLADSLADQVSSVFEEARKNDKTDLQKLEEQVKLAQAQKQLQDAQAALVEAEPEPGEAEVAGLAADTAVKQAEVANINAEIALIEARRKLNEAEGS